MMGEGDPGNRRMMNFELNKNELSLNESFSILNKMRQTYPSLAIGDQIVLQSDGSVLAILKIYFNEKILLVINQSPNDKTVQVDFSIYYKFIGKLRYKKK